MAYTHSGKPLRPCTDPVEKRGFGVWGKHGLRHADWLPSGFFDTPAQKETGPRVKRTARKHPLTSIAEQLPTKLPRVLFDL